MKNVSVIMVNDPGGLEALTFQLTVTDGRGLTSTDTCVVNVAWTNRPPTANAGQDQTTSRGQTLTLDGSGSMDPDDGLASVWWTQTRGTPVELSDPAALRPTFTAPTLEGDQEALTFELTVLDKTGLASQDTCVINLG